MNDVEDELSEDEEIIDHRDSVLIRKAATRRYQENLMKDINVAFNRKSKLPDISVSCDSEWSGKGVVEKAQALDEQFNKIYEESNSNRKSCFNQAYEEWAAVAQEAAITPRPSPKTFCGKTWILPNRGENRSPSEECELESSTKTELYKIARELLTTERTYVGILRDLDQIYYKKILEASERHVIPGSVANQIFQHLSAIFYFHSIYLLPQLEERLANWENKPRIGDIMMQAGPFLKMYAMYIDNHTVAQETVVTWKKKSKDFFNLIDQIQKNDPKGNSLESNMLTPVQRTPRYKLLLERYLKKLPDSVEQREEVETALNLVAVAASHSDHYITRRENSLKLVKIYESLANISFSTEGCSRALLKEGKVTKIAARSGKENDRYLYLFCDLLLCCKESSSVQRVQGKTLQVSVTFNLIDLVASINESKSSTFYLNGVEKHMEVLCKSTCERDNWVQSINDAAAEQTRNLNSFHQVRSNSIGEVATRPMFVQKDGFLTPQISRKQPVQKNNSISASVRKNFLKEETLGLRAPEWVKDNDVTMCMGCSESFHSILRRRHHCRACGRVVCSACSKRSVMLPYRPSSSQRVCDSCHDIFNTVSSIPPQGKNNQFKPEESTLLSSYYNVNYKHRWSRLWCVISEATPHLCICYKAKMDSKPFLLFSFHGCKMSSMNKDGNDSSFQLTDILGNKFIFASDDKNLLRKLQKLIKNNVQTKDRLR